MTHERPAKAMTLRRRLWVRYYGYRRFAGFRLPGGITVLSFDGNMSGFSLISRHPRWSLTWLWFIRISFGRDRMEAPWWRRFAFLCKPSILRQAWLRLGWVHVGVFWQDSMAKRPGEYGHDRAQWVRYCDRIARRRVRIAAEAAYRHEFALLMEPPPQEEGP